MKYTELKVHLKTQLDSAYLIFGDDRYLCYDALKKIEDSLNLTIKDMNSVTISGDSTTATDIVTSANLYPFGDLKRLVIVKDFSPSKGIAKEEYKTLENYLKQPLDSTIIVFFNPETFDFYKGMKGLTQVDCSKIDTKTISAYVKNFLGKNEIQSSEDAIEKLIMFCGNDMSRVTNELEKLSAYVADTKVLTADVVEEFVVQDNEYQVYELAEFIAKNDAKHALDLVDSFTHKAGTAFTILSPLFNNYRRALFVSINKDKTTAELATLFGVKEFAVRMLKNQVQAFSPKKLKTIVDMIAEYDKKIKLGEMKENLAIKTITINILNLRGQDDR